MLMPSDISPASSLFTAAATSQPVVTIDDEGPIRMTLSLWPRLFRLTALCILIAGAVTCERVLAEALGDHMIAIILLLIMAIFTVTLGKSLFIGSTRP